MIRIPAGSFMMGSRISAAETKKELRRFGRVVQRAAFPTPSVADQRFLDGRDGGGASVMKGGDGEQSISFQELWR